MVRSGSGGNSVTCGYRSRSLPQPETAPWSKEARRSSAAGVSGKRKPHGTHCIMRVAARASQELPVLQVQPVQPVARTGALFPRLASVDRRDVHSSSWTSCANPPRGFRAAGGKGAGQKPALKTTADFGARTGRAYNTQDSARTGMVRALVVCTMRGRNGFDGGEDSRDACRAPLTRKSDGTSVNCGYTVRSRCLISSERLPRPRLVVGGQMSLSRLVIGRRLGVRSRDFTGSGACRLLAVSPRRA
jgi:hypothetical protein